MSSPWRGESDLSFRVPQAERSAKVYLFARASVTSRDPNGSHEQTHPVLLLKERLSSICTITRLGWRSPSPSRKRTGDDSVEGVVHVFDLESNPT